jgi:hypothetical protein
MANDAKKTSGLPIATSANNTDDRVVILTNPSTNPVLKTIPAYIFAAAIAPLISVAATNTSAQYAWSNTQSFSNTITFSSNTLVLGTSTQASNGYTYLPNGMKMNWGTFVCNTSSKVTFTSPFSTALVSLNVTPIGQYYIGANTPYVYSSNTSSANVYSASTTTTNTAYYLAVGY